MMPPVKTLAWGTVVVLANILALRDQQVAGARPGSCDATTDTIYMPSAAYCEDSSSGLSFTDGGSTTGINEACCGDYGTERDDMRRILQTLGSDESSRCRSIELDTAFCPSDSDCVVSETNLTMDVSFVADDTSCCSTCQCWGDPFCVDFAGEREEWVICDSRNKNTCNQQRSKCKKHTYDHLGNQCVWVKNSKLVGESGSTWRGWDLDGSPCQSKSIWTGDTSKPLPVMLMYSRNDFSIYLILGERGVITNTKIVTADGTNYTLNAMDCLDNPNSTSVWEIEGTSSSLPDSWSVSELSEYEVQWRIASSDGLVFANATCVRLAERARLDLTVIDTQNTNTTSGSPAGYCPSGVIAEKAIAYSKGEKNTLSTAHSSTCVQKEIGSCGSACKAFVTQDCQVDYNLDRNVKYWCSITDLSYLDTPMSADECYEAIMTPTDGETCNAAAWADMICEIDANLVGTTNYYDKCLSTIAEFGFYQYYDERLAEDLTPHLPTQPYGATSCGASVADYGLQTSDCERGAAVEYYDADLDYWVQAFFIPESKPPCNGSLSILGSEYPVLLQNPIRVSQCSVLESKCQIENACQPVSGVNVDFLFSASTEACPTDERPTKAPTPQPTLLPTAYPTSMPTISPIEACYLDDIKYKGDQIGSYKRLTSLELCQEFCLSKDACEYFSFFGKRNKCFIYRSITEEVAVSASKLYVSASKECVVEPSGETPAPTLQPTIDPASSTGAPSLAPSNVPTSSPTDVPTLAPTDAPTQAPSDAPISAPSDVPTSSPTDVPTQAPSDAPTSAPSDVPTSSPTDTPTQAPSDAPTSAPSDMPTSDVPTSSPTDAPTSAPSDAPTSAPSDVPTSSPTDVPTQAPSDAPTSAPSDVPTSSPTGAPTSAPSDAPTSAPSDVPTSSPTDAPTSAPSDAPTSAPSDVPTSSPTDVPTQAPSDAPTSAPSDVPTSSPTDAPTSAPSDVPTSSPTDAPTSAPSDVPTVQPTLSPSTCTDYTLGRWTPAGYDTIKNVATWEDCQDLCDADSECNYWSYHGVATSSNDNYGYTCILFNSVNSLTQTGSQSTWLSSCPITVTSSPTLPPSPTPTLAPSDAPTSAPTDAPTSAPTDAPTSAPTDAPTSAPTDAPTVAPSDAPTSAPTDAPTSAPTDAPTLAPSDAPTSAPTDAPTLAPSDAPTSAPTDAPTLAPSDAPTSAPTDAPTLAPSDAPTQAPSSSPTPSPTPFPTSNPVSSAGDTSSPTGSPGTCSGTTPGHYNGNNMQKLNDYSKIETYQECEELCEEDPECNFWSYHGAEANNNANKGYHCHTFSSYQSFVETGDSSTWVSNCPGDPVHGGSS